MFRSAQNNPSTSEMVKAPWKKGVGGQSWAPAPWTGDPASRAGAVTAAATKWRGTDAGNSFMCC